MKTGINKILMIAGVLLFAVAFATGCGSKSYNIAESGEWTDGSYTETAEGKNGDFDVTVTIENGEIASVAVGLNYEDEDVGGDAIRYLVSDFVDEQTYDVDVISGATITSNALKDAVARCLEDASVDSLSEGTD